MLKLNLKGKHFGKLTVMEELAERGDNGSVVWLCRCECGNQIKASVKNLTAPDIRAVRSCGCLKAQNLKRNTSTRSMVSPISSMVSVATNQTSTRSVTEPISSIKLTDQIVIQDFMKNLRQEITRRRKENRDERAKRRWNAEGIVHRFQSDLLDYIEDQLDLIAAARTISGFAAKPSKKRKRRKHVSKSKSNGLTAYAGIGEGIC